MVAEKKRIVITNVILLAIAALILGFYFSQQLHEKQTILKVDFHGTLLEKPRQIQTFSLTGTDNKPYNNQSLEGQWTMIFFGFTSCGYLCPTTMAELAKMYKLLENQSVKPLPHVVMITIDPEQDSLTGLDKYVKGFHSSFFAARGEEPMIIQMTREMGVAYEKILPPPGDTSTHYDFQHSGAVMLFNPKGQLIAFFTTPHEAEILAKDYALLVS